MPHRRHQSPAPLPVGSSNGSSSNIDTHTRSNNRKFRVDTQSSQSRQLRIDFFQEDE